MNDYRPAGEVRGVITQEGTLLDAQGGMFFLRFPQVHEAPQGSVIACVCPWERDG